MRSVLMSSRFPRKFQSIARQSMAYRLTSSHMLRLAPVATDSSESRSTNSLWWIASAVGFATAIVGHNLASSDAETPAPPGHPAATLPLMTYDAFKKGKPNRVWVTLDGGVYDVT